MLLIDFLGLVPDEVCIEVLLPGYVPCSLSELSAADKTAALESEVVEVYPLGHEWLGIRVSD